MSLEFETVEEENSNVIPFDRSRRATLTGGRGVIPWLLTIPEGSHFVIRQDKDTTGQLILVILESIYSEDLAIIKFPQFGKIEYVYPLFFCRNNILHKILHIGEVEVE